MFVRAVITIFVCVLAAACVEAQVSEALPALPAQSATAVSNLTGVFRSPDGDFTVRLPGTPEVESMKAKPDAFNIKNFTVFSAPVMYTVSRADVPKGVRSLTALRAFYDQAREQSVANDRVVLLSEREVKLGDYLGREVTLEVDAIVMRSRLFLVGKRRYDIMVGVSDVAAPERSMARLDEESKLFLDSFNFVEANTPQLLAPPPVKKGKTK